MSEATAKPAKKPKKKGPIRTEAILPVLILWILTFLYFTYYFDRHLKELIEYVGTQANGAEVNVGDLDISFLRGSFDLDKLQVTSPDRPSHNSLEVENIHFQFLWDALLRMKFVVVDSSINNVQLMKPRKSPGRVLPPSPAKPSKLEQMQMEVMAQVKNKYGKNVLADMVALLEGGDFKDQLQNIRMDLKSEARAQAMVAEVDTKKEFWDNRVKQLSDTSKLKSIEQQINAIKSEKNFIQQAAGAKKLNDLLKEVKVQSEEVRNASKQLQNEINTITNYPNQLQQMVNQDVNALKDRFQIPKIDFKDMAMHLFAGDFAGHIAKARKYQAVAQSYVPEKKEQKEIVPPKRAEGKTYLFPVTRGYPLFWLKRAGLSSKGTAESYSGNVSGEITNVTTDPKQIKKPIKLNMNGDFPGAKIMGVEALVTVDHTRVIGKQSAFIKVNSFPVPEKMFSNDEKIKFGFLNAIGSSTVTAEMEQENIKMNWTSSFSQPKFLVETDNKLAHEIITKVVNGISVVNLKGRAAGKFSNLKMDLSSNLGEELGQGFMREIGAKVAEAQQKLNTLVEEKINKPKQELLAKISGTKTNLNSLQDVQGTYKKYEQEIKGEIAKLKTGGNNPDQLKEKGKKLLKGIKL